MSLPLYNILDIDGEDLNTRILKLQFKCGDLCDTNKQIKEGEFIGTVKSEVKLHVKFIFNKIHENQVNCPKLFTTLKDFSDSAPRMKPPRWENLTKEIQNYYSYNKR